MVSSQKDYDKVATYGGLLKAPDDILKIAERAFELNKDRSFEANKATGGTRDTSAFGPSRASYQRMIDNALTGKLGQEDPILHPLINQAISEYKSGGIGATPTAPTTPRQFNIDPIRGTTTPIAPSKYFNQTTGQYENVGQDGSTPGPMPGVINDIPGEQRNKDGFTPEQQQYADGGWKNMTEEQRLEFEKRTG